MRELDAEFDLGLFDRMKASFVENGEVKTLKLADFKNKIRSGEVSKDITRRFLLDEDIFLRIHIWTF